MISTPSARERDAQPRGRRSAVLEQARALGVVLREEFGVPFRFYDAATGEPVGIAGPGEPDPPPPPEDRAEVVRLASEDRTLVRCLAGGRFELILPFSESGRPVLVATGVIAALARAGPESVQELARLRKWLQTVHDRLRLADRSFAGYRSDAANDGRTNLAWDALLGIEHLLGALRIQSRPDRGARLILRVAADLLNARSVVWVPCPSVAETVVDGDPGLSPWECSRMASLLAQAPDWPEAGFLVRNDLGTDRLAARFPRVANLLAVPVPGRGTTGWMIALNKTEGPSTPPPGAEASRDWPVGAGRPPSPRDIPPPGIVPFRRADAALLSSFATLLGMHLRASGRYEGLNRLMVGLTRSLAAAIDARDSYASGHSERVARVAVELGRTLGMDEPALSDVYLAGLLHDIGKIGIHDAVLRKRGPLTAEEFDHIKQHVTIGHRILADLRPIRSLLPGVLYHHERYDGSGYPEGLEGDAIPFLARVLAVADGYVAMSTARPYRDAMPSDHVEATLIRGAGSQWDRSVIDALLRNRAKVDAIRRRGVGEPRGFALRDALPNCGHPEPSRSP
jgi:HD-GYP domain-containing protein (c-di-GMP phosphodiesterase class II)